MLYRIAASILLYIILPLIWASLGVLMIQAPVRFAHFINENFALLPRISQNDTGWKAWIRIAGGGLLAFAAHFVWKAVQLFW